MNFGCTRKRVVVAVGLFLITVGGIICGLAGQELLRLSNVVQAKCRIEGFQADMERSIVIAGRTCERSCGFYVSVAAEGQPKFYVLNWMPEYRESYHSSTGFVAEHEAFSCCPTTAEDCCGFEDQDSGLFCDSYGAVRAECPAGPWPCYYEPMDEEQLARGLPASALFVGDSREKATQAMVGLIICCIGALECLCIRPSIFVAPCFCLSKAFFGSRFYFRVAKKLPRGARTSHMQLMVETDAAIRIQRIIRRLKAQERFRDAIRSCSQIIQRERKFRANILPMSHEQLYGPKPKGVPAQNLLYDTGDAATFRRVVHARVVDSPDPALQRIEVSLTKQAAWLSEILRVGRDKLGRELAPEVAGQPPRAFAEVYGIRAGHRLIGVGSLEYPQASGTQLLRAARDSRRPVVLLFEGPAPEFEQISRKIPPPGTLVPPPLWRDLLADGGAAARKGGKAAQKAAARSGRPSPNPSRRASKRTEQEGEEDPDLEAGAGGGLPGQPESAAATPASSRRRRSNGRPSLTVLTRRGPLEELDEEHLGAASPTSVASSPALRRSFFASKDPGAAAGRKRAQSVGGSPSGGRRRTKGWTSGRFSPLRWSRGDSDSPPPSPSRMLSKMQRRRRSNPVPRVTSAPAGRLRRSASISGGEDSFPPQVDVPSEGGPAVQ